MLLERLAGMLQWQFLIELNGIFTLITEQKTELKAFLDEKDAFALLLTGWLELLLPSSAGRKNITGLV